MINSVYSVFDTKASAFLQPFHAINNAVACRMIADAVAEPNHMFNKHAADFVLFELGEFDDTTGIFTSKTHVNLGTLLTYIPNDNNVVPMRAS
jgi:hypothetical protein